MGNVCGTPRPNSGRGSSVVLTAFILSSGISLTFRSGNDKAGLTVDPLASGHRERVPMRIFEVRLFLQGAADHFLDRYSESLFGIVDHHR
jgi:hypothetical protein